MNDTIARKFTPKGPNLPVTAELLLSFNVLLLLLSNESTSVKTIKEVSLFSSNLRSKYELNILCIEKVYNYIAYTNHKKSYNI